MTPIRIVAHVVTSLGCFGAGIVVGMPGDQYAAAVLCGLVGGFGISIHILIDKNYLK